jgi:hypothetical protein
VLVHLCAEYEAVVPGPSAVSQSLLLLLLLLLPTSIRQQHHPHNIIPTASAVIISTPSLAFWPPCR